MKDQPGSLRLVRGSAKDSFLGKHPGLRAIDKAIGWLAMIGMLTTELVGFLGALWGLSNGLTAFDVMNMASAFCATAVAVLAFILWHALCYYDHRMRKLMTTPTRFTPEGFMRGGFLPIPAAASVGLLLFVTAAIISVSVMEGGMLQNATGGSFVAWLPGMTCRACAVNDADYVMSWTGRADRTAPWPEPNGFSRLQKLLEDTPKAEGAMKGACFMAGFEFAKEDVIDADGKDKYIENLLSPKEGKGICMYECALWKTINLRTVINSSGAISIGAGIVVVITSWVSGKFGIRTVNEQTKPDELVRLLRKAAPGSFGRNIFAPLQMSMTGAAVPIIMTGALLKYMLVSKIDADGFYTVDYFVLFVLLYSALMVTLLRVWHPFQARPQIYTSKLWNQGFGNFVVRRKMFENWGKLYGAKEFKRIKDIGELLVLVKIDLYQWMHIRGQERAELLINYCKRPDKDGAGSTLVTMAAQEVKVMHKIIMKSGEQVHTEKSITLEGGHELKMIKFKNDCQVLVTCTINEKEETLVMDKLEVLEKSDEWEKATSSLKDYLQHADLDQELLASH